MLDIKKIRKDPEKFREGLRAKGAEDKLDSLIELDAERRQRVTEVDELKSVRNRVSEEIGNLKRSGESAEDKILEMRNLGDQIKSIDAGIADIDESIKDIMISLPNIPHNTVKVGFTPEENEVVKIWAEKPDYDFQLKDHYELGESLGIMDFPRASKISGSGFPMYVGLGAKLERAVINFMLDYHVSKHGYKEIFPPFLTNRNSAFGTGQLPKLEDDMYVTKEDDLFLIPTAEVPVTNIHRDEILNEKMLPLKYTAYSACFRREAGSYGKDIGEKSQMYRSNERNINRIK